MQLTQTSLIVRGQNNVNQESIPVEERVPTAEVASTMGGGGVGYTLPFGYPTPASQILRWIPKPPPRYITTSKKGHETKDSLPPERTWYQGYLTLNVDRHL